MTHHRPYPPDFCDAETMAYLLDMSSSTFRSLVADGLLPQGVKFRNYPQAPRRWNRVAVLEAVKAINLPPKERDDPIMRGILHGQEIDA
jgi:hypothetical protein